MAGTVTITNQDYRSVMQAIFAWVSNSAGDANGQTTFIVSGEILRITTIPASAPDSPSANYDVVINDEDGIDVAQGLLANRSQFSAESIVPLQATTVSGGVTPSASPVFVDSKLTLVVSNGGNAKHGTVRVYYSR